MICDKVLNAQSIAPDTRTKEKHTESALIVHDRYHDEGDEFLDRIITGDETWTANIKLFQTATLNEMP